MPGGIALGSSPWVGVGHVGPEARGPRAHVGPEARGCPSHGGAWARAPAATGCASGWYGTPWGRRAGSCGPGWFGLGRADRPGGPKSGFWESFDPLAGLIDLDSGMSSGSEPGELKPSKLGPRPQQIAQSIGGVLTITIG